jgi:NAD(P)-dependent dehydrogenase (short-subunit alcohol dehydrogenase family)
MDSQFALVTGGSSGIGLATARGLAKAGYGVFVVARDSERGEAARDEVAQVSTGPEPGLLLADLSSQAQVRDLADEVRTRLPKLDVLLNVAGASFQRREFTVDGIEKTFATNHLAPFLLTNLLLDKMREAPAGRIVTVTSETHSAKIDFDNLQGEKHYNFWDAYNHSKLENLLFTYELARRLMGSGVTTNAVSPGPARTHFGDNMGGLPGLLIRTLKATPLPAPPEKAARGPIYVASSPDVDGVSGRFFMRTKETKSKPITYDQNAARRLWEVSEQLTVASRGGAQTLVELAR